MKKFRPKLDQTYWMLNSRWEVKQTELTGSCKSIGRVEAGNCFKTKQEAQEFATTLKRIRAGKLQVGTVKRSRWAFWRG